MKLQQVHQKLHDSYHGNPVAGMLPMVHDCIKGVGCFNALWDQLDGENGTSLTLSRSMTQKDDVLYSAGSHFTVASLARANQSTPVIMDGRSIFSLAQSALKNGKKALSVEKSAYVDGKLPSGWNDNDLDQHILNGMWSMLQSRSSTLNVDGDDEKKEPADEPAGATVERPETWFFSGWMAYRLLGPRAHNDFMSPLFEIGDWDRNKRTSEGDSKGAGGRADHRKALADQSNTIRMNDECS